MQVVSAQGHTVRAALVASRNVLDIDLKDSREILRSGGEDGCYRVHLASGHVVEATVIRGCKAEAHLSHLV